jgi:hypothetical protein
VDPSIEPTNDAATDPATDPAAGPATEYRLAPAIVVRSAGAALVLLAVAVAALSVLTSAAGWGFWLVGLVALLGLAAVAGGAWWATRRAYVVRLDALGYQVRLLRGAGVKRARWADVAEASPADVRGVPCVVLALRDGRTTTVPVAVLAADRDEVVGRLRDLLRRGR